MKTETDIKTFYYLGLIFLFIGLSIFFGVLAGYCHEGIKSAKDSSYYTATLNQHLIYYSFILLIFLQFFLQYIHLIIF